MREIKFRAWIEESKTMETGLFGLRSDGKPSFNKEAVLLQYTGLKDKNGKEIYEGDILNYGHKNNNVEVKFENGCFSVFGEPLGWDFDSEEKPILIDNYSNHAVIVGNIYENPDLLNR